MSRPLDYQGQEWVTGTLPSAAIEWPGLPAAELRGYAQSWRWEWPAHPLFFFCDLHADADAFFTSLVASGGVAKTGPQDEAFELTDAGRGATFVIGGDTFDKGPSTLRLLDALKRLRGIGARVEVLAGNHDLRTLLGLAYAEASEPRLAHLFVRLGPKAVRLFKDIYQRYLAGADVSTLSERDAFARLFPGPQWFEAWPRAVAGELLPARIEKELHRIREKIDEMQAACQADGLTLGMLHAAQERAGELLLDAEGEWRWYFDEMALAKLAGSFLLIHAGLDDATAALIGEQGVAGLTRAFHELLADDLYALYHGPIGNTIRTKYQAAIDLPLTAAGIAELHEAGVHALVHGHKQGDGGQRAVIRDGLLHIECDAVVDRNTRRLRGLEGAGGAVLILDQAGLLGISTDSAQGKLLPAAVFDRAAIG